MRFNKNSDIQLREMIGDRPWAIRTVRVISDKEDSVLLWLAAGSRFLIPDGYLHNPNFRNERWEISKSGQWHMTDTTWERTHVLILKELSAYYSVQLFWDAGTNAFLGYYVNFDLPYQRVSTGFDTLDLELDMMVYPNMTTEMKDVDEYAEAVRSGDIEPDWATGIESAKTDLLKAIRERSFPFDDSLLSSKPNIEMA